MNRRLAFVFGLLLASPVAWADGTGPGRKMTGPEALAYQEVHDTIQNAMPKASEGYAFKFELTGERAEGEVSEGLGPSEMHRMPFLATYTLELDNSAEVAQAALMEQTKGTPEQQAKMAEFEAKAAGLKKARDDAGTREEKDRIRAQLKAVQAEANALQDEIMTQFQAWLSSGGATAVQQSAAASAPAKWLNIRAVVNSAASLLDTATPYKIEGLPLAFEGCEGSDGGGDYCITVLLGPFTKAEKISGRDHYRLPEGRPGVPTKARGIAVTFAGPNDKAESVRELLPKTNLELLKALVD